MTGPKIFPIPAVPRFCTRNRQTSTIIAPGTTNFFADSSARPTLGAATVMPSSALRTEMLGVMAPSP